MDYALYLIRAMWEKDKPICWIKNDSLHTLCS